MPIANGRDWCNLIVTDGELICGKLMLSTGWCIPENLRLGGIQLQSVGAHPVSYSGKTIRHFWLIMMHRQTCLSFLIWVAQVAIPICWNAQYDHNARLLCPDRRRDRRTNIMAIARWFVLTHRALKTVKYWLRLDRVQNFILIYRSGRGHFVGSRNCIHIQVW